MNEIKKAMNGIKVARLKRMRRLAFELQEKFLDELCNDGEREETKLELAFCRFLWEIDEETRRLLKG